MRNGTQQGVDGRQVAPREITTVATNLTRNKEAQAESESFYERLLKAVESHITEEHEAIHAYRKLARSGKDPFVRFIFQHIVTDEERHHVMLRRMAATLGGSNEHQDLDELLPSGPRVQWQADAATLATVRSYARAERVGARELRKLARESAYFYSGIFQVLLESMALDSRKHERLLRFALRRMEEQLKPSHVLLAKHQHVNKLLAEAHAELAEGVVALGKLQEIERLLNQHMYLEEEALYPRLEAYGIGDRLQAALQEHGEVCRYMAAVIERAEAGEEADRVAETLKAMRELLDEHHLREEFVLYPAMDALLTRRQWWRLKDRQAPPGWTCLAHRGMLAA